MKIQKTCKFGSKSIYILSQIYNNKKDKKKINNYMGKCPTHRILKNIDKTR